VGAVAGMIRLCRPPIGARHQYRILSRPVSWRRWEELAQLETGPLLPSERRLLPDRCSFLFTVSGFDFVQGVALFFSVSDGAECFDTIRWP
jgi:hypothetical protein